MEKNHVGSPCLCCQLFLALGQSLQLAVISLGIVRNLCGIHRILFTQALCQILHLTSVGRHTHPHMSVAFVGMVMSLFMVVFLLMVHILLLVIVLLLVVHILLLVIVLLLVVHILLLVVVLPLDGSLTTCGLHNGEILIFFHDVVQKAFHITAVDYKQICLGQKLQIRRCQLIIVKAARLWLAKVCDLKLRYSIDKIGCHHIHGIKGGHNILFFFRLLIRIQGHVDSRQSQRNCQNHG